ncbi:hypothetical protein Q8A67_021057 [Cirrhinus molitorella]|uniref:Uncharacterized protein n=1 Tax=Cirrhinus molitorella TaxID=172907 RepID=A0AA88PEM3_9TELE|nr:hypothetical protein Q8A67_021057 [Cirrhinus molitorella]
MEKALSHHRAPPIIEGDVDGLQSDGSVFQHVIRIGSQTTEYEGPIWLLGVTRQTLSSRGRLGGERASGLTGQLDLHRDSFTSVLTIGQCVQVQRILFLKPLFEGNTGRVSLLKLQRLCRSAVCGFCQGTSAAVLETVWILGVPDCMGGLFSLFALPSLEWHEDGWASRTPPQNEHHQERLTPNLFSTKPPCRPSAIPKANSSCIMPKIRTGKQTSAIIQTSPWKRAFPDLSALIWSRASPVTMGGMENRAKVNMSERM